MPTSLYVNYILRQHLNHNDHQIVPQITMTMVYSVLKEVKCKQAVSALYIAMHNLYYNHTTSALTTNFHILVSRGGGWFGISRTIKF